MITADTTRFANAEAAADWVLYDGECFFCKAGVARLTPLLHRHHFELAALQTPWVQERLQLFPGEPLAEMKLLRADGRVYGGAEAIGQICRKIWWAWPLYAFSNLPGARWLLGAAYRQVASRRNCLGGHCAVRGKGTP